MKSITKRRARTVLIPLALLAAMSGGQLFAQNPGTANISMLANTGFDAYTFRPSSATQQWIRDHFYRMTVYSPYFDSRTSWYPRGDVYLNLYGIQRGSSLQSQHPEWILKDQQGNWLSFPWG